MYPEDEVEEFEERLEYVLNMQRTNCRFWDWAEYASSLPPVEPRRFTTNQLSALQQQTVSKALLMPPVIDQIAAPKYGNEPRTSDPSDGGPGCDGHRARGLVAL